jgi:hypothetical protein
MHLNEGYLGTIVHFVAKVSHSTMHSIINFMKCTYYHCVKKHLYKKMTLIAKKIFLVLKTIATIHGKKN